MSSDAGKVALERIREIGPFIQGSLTVTKKRCGHPACRCAIEGPCHQTALLTWKEGGRTRTLYVPIELRQEVESWVEEGKLLKSLIANMSQAQRELLIRRRKDLKHNRV
jgi:hypothetical protein